MGKKSKRVEIGSDDKQLTDNPFAGLSDVVSSTDLPNQVLTPESAPATIVYKEQHPYTIARTRKGGWPVRKEKRSAGKLVTLLDNVSGDSRTLLKELQKALGVGGKVDGHTVQLQGDHVEAVQKFLDGAFRN